jgi:hypothetical protein
VPNAGWTGALLIKPGTMFAHFIQKTPVSLANKGFTGVFVQQQCCQHFKPLCP